MNASNWTAPEGGWFTTDPDAPDGWRKMTTVEIAMRPRDPAAVAVTFETLPGVSAEELPALKAGILALAASPLAWHYGPTDTDPDPGRMWCSGCGAEVYALDDGYICTGCERQAE